MLTWYDQQGRTLPWRIRPEDRAKGAVPDPYAVWLSEIMLQQTTVPHATPYWQRFLERFPTVTDLANADRDEVLSMWAGLGYYARARNLHKCAQMVRDDFDGVFPLSEAVLLKLPGIGAYTAATMAAICAGEATNIVDGNVERVISRVFRIETPLPKGKAEIRRAAGTLADPDRPGDYGQALMDLGATICTPRSPQCDHCVWSWGCAGFAGGVQTDYPKKSKKKKLPTRFGAVFILISDGAVLLERRQDQGLLGGMMGFPGTDWGDPPSEDAMSRAAPVSRNWQKLDGQVRHVFTHFALTLDIYRAEIAQSERPKGLWFNTANLEKASLPTVMKKCWQLDQKDREAR